jgi:ribulose-phosphate 3-epimerase
MLEIIPGILTDNPQELKDLIAQADGKTKRVHIDIIDGVFADNETIDPSVLNDVDHGLLIDFHLMVNEPARWVEKCVRAGGDRIIGQVEMMNSISEFISEVTEAGLSVGLGIDLDTPVKMIERRLLSDVDVVLVMSVPAGFGGQKFHREALAKIKELNKIRESDKTPFAICDDGGVTFEYIDDVADAKADEVVIGQRIFKGDLAKNIAAYKKAA